VFSLQVLLLIVHYTNSQSYNGLELPLKFCTVNPAFYKAMVEIKYCWL